MVIINTLLIIRIKDQTPLFRFVHTVYPVKNYDFSYVLKIEEKKITFKTRNIFSVVDMKSSFCENLKVIRHRNLLTVISKIYIFIMFL